MLPASYAVIAFTVAECGHAICISREPQLQLDEEDGLLGRGMDLVFLRIDGGRDKCAELESWDLHANCK